MPTFGDPTREIKTIKDLKDLLTILVDQYQLKNDTKIKLDVYWPHRTNLKLYVSGDISYSENEVLLECDEEEVM